MSRKSRIWRNKADEEVEVRPQRFSWKRHKTFKTYDEADKVRKELKKESKLVKIRRCGPDGTMFKVVTGSPVKVNKPKTKKEEAKDATK